MIRLLSYYDQICLMEMLHNQVIRFLAISAYVVMFNCVAIAQYRMSFRCADDQYEYTDSSDNIECRQCSTCPPGFGVIKLCSFYNDTMCEACPRGSYSVSNSRRDSCLRCRECESHQLTRTECTTTNNRECSRSCSTGYFFDNVANRCYKCGYCYSGYGTPVRISECNVQGVSRDYQCMIIRNIPSRNQHYGWFRDQGNMDTDNVQNTEMFTERLIDTTTLQASMFHTNDEDFATISDIITDTKREKHPVTLTNISVNKVLHDIWVDAQNSRNELIMIAVFITVFVVAAILFVVYYLQWYNKTNYIKTCLKETKDEANYIKIPKVPIGNKFSKGILFSHVLKTEVASGKGTDSASV